VSTIRRRAPLSVPPRRAATEPAEARGRVAALERLRHVVVGTLAAQALLQCDEIGELVEPETIDRGDRANALDNCLAMLLAAAPQ